MNDVADLPLIDRFLQFGISGIKMQHMRHHHAHTGLSCRSRDLTRFALGRGDRLFNQKVQSLFGRVQRVFQMELIGRADADGIQSGLVAHSAKISVPLAAVSLCSGARRALVDIRHRGKHGVWTFMDNARMKPADQPQSDNPDPKWILHGQSPFCICRCIYKFVLFPN